MAPHRHSQRRSHEKSVADLIRQSKPYRDLLLDYRKLLLMHNRLEVRNQELESQIRSLLAEKEAVNGAS
jgi:hypothetical protein